MKGTLTRDFEGLKLVLKLCVLQNAFQFDQSPAKPRCKFVAVLGRLSANICEENSDYLEPLKICSSNLKVQMRFLQ